ncbi:SPOR domain-containing protein [Halobacillus sp. Cin3]|uniref:SPOR domain-containing protein n=1 Tax=Halobacillus sp. Cin3 TaxID=2928441 RepID=UPI00248F2235|nr:SPOR domain-containing protein [Halobacillus sp. Cin3]
MDSKKKISISFRPENGSKNEVVRTQNEQAAAVDQDKEKDKRATPVYPLPVKKKWRIPGSYRPVLATAVIALLLSLGIGFVLLRMFVSLTDVTTAGTETLPSPEAPAGQVQGAEEGAENQLPASAAATLDTYIVQAGAFSTEGKAGEWQSRLNAQSISSVIWKRDGQYFLFVGSASSKQEAAYMAEEMKSKSIETYVKPWVVTIEKELPPALQEGMKTHTLGSINESQRKEIAKAAGEDSALGQALVNWESQDENNLNWLKVAKSLE